MTDGSMVQALGGGAWADDLVSQFPKFAKGLSRAADVVDRDLFI